MNKTDAYTHTHVNSCKHNLAKDRKIETHKVSSSGSRLNLILLVKIDAFKRKLELSIVWYIHYYKG